MDNVDYYKRKYKAKASQIRKDRNGNPILMKLTFEQWYEIWLASGHIHEMGPGRLKYVMCRCDDLGHYEVGNVYVNLVLNNSLESCKEITPEDVKINALTIKTGYSRRTVRAMIRRGELFI